MIFIYFPICILIGIILGIYWKKILHKLIAYTKNIKENQDILKKYDDSKTITNENASDEDDEIDFEDEDLKMVFK